MENNKRPTQCDRIMRHLNDYKSITAIEAQFEYGIMRLASRMNELKNNGVDFTKEMVKGTNRYGEPTRYARYSIK